LRELFLSENLISARVPANHANYAHKTFSVKNAIELNGTSIKIVWQNQSAAKIIKNFIVKVPNEKNGFKSLTVRQQAIGLYS